MTVVEVPVYEVAACHATKEDRRGDPMRCVIANYIRRQYPWARNVSAGEREIKVYDYRCEHNPEGKIGACETCPGRALVWSTPRPAARAIKEFDRGGDPEFPAFQLRENEAEAVPARQDPVRKRQAMKRYTAEVKAGVRTVNKRSAKAKAAAQRERRKA